ncbi:MAG TPA: hypothetical protein VNB90_02370 [Cytophagaceae bacterium]|nr:hypothetical protein [Cytophagaceae bacterium]
MNRGWSVVVAGLMFLILSGCYKKDLEDFKNINYSTERSFAFPVFETTLTLKDSLPYTIPVFTMADTVKADFKLGSYISNYSGDVDYVEFKMVLKSNFPVTGAVQIYFADNNGTITDSLFTYNNAVLQAADGNNFNQTTLSVYMDKNKFKQIEQSPKVYIYYMLQTSDPKGYASNQLQINSGIKFGITF